MNLARSLRDDDDIAAKVPVEKDLDWCALIFLGEFFDESVFN